MKRNVSTAQIKPKMPDPKPTVKLEPISARLMCDFSRYSNGSLAMTIADVGLEVSQDGKKIGSIYGAIGGGIVVTIGTGDKSSTWAIGMKDLFAAVKDAVESQYL